LVYALGTKFLLLSAIIYAPGTALYVWARRERRQQVFTKWEWALFLLGVVGAAIGVYGLVTGGITI
jgi:arginine:ornithine antiporter/lysine permease